MQSKTKFTIIAVLLLCTMQVLGQKTTTVKGSVLSENSTVLQGVSIKIIDMETRDSAFSYTDSAGIFKVDMRFGHPYALYFNYVGYQRDSLVNFLISAGETNSILMRLREDRKALSEVVVIGYGSVKKSDLTGSVSTVTADKVTQVSGVSNVAQALQGQAAGVRVNQASGQPGEGVRIQIRGTNSINANNDPLYVVDGLPLDGLSAQLNPDDIQNIEILKDASSTAIYGSRGANGVIIITTKQGKAGNARVSYNGYYGIQTLRKKMDLLNAHDFAALQNEVVTNDNNAGVNSPVKELPWSTAQLDSLTGKGTDWQDLVYRPAPMQNHNVSISGGSENTVYYTSFGYYDQNGIIRNSDFSRMSFRANVNHHFNDKLSLGTSLSIQRSKYVQAVYTGADGGGGIPFTTMVMPPTQGVYDENGQYTIFTGVSWGATNPVGISKELYDPSTNLRIIGNVNLKYQVFRDLSLKLSAGVDNSYNKSDYYAPSIISIGTPGGKASKNYGNSATFVNENLLSYLKKFGKHRVDIVAGMTYQSSTAEGLNSGTVSSFPSDIFQNNNLGATTATITSLPSGYGSSFSDYKLISYLGRVNYNYSDKYYATVTSRYDGSSKFGRNNKFSFFPSGALAWRISQEDFLKNNATLSNLKLRVSYGISGNQAISPYQTISSLSNVTLNFGNIANTGFVLSGLDNPDLKWETTHELDAGVDIGFFHDRIQLTADWYAKKTDHLLLLVTPPPSSGFSSYYQNMGAVQNRGFEFQLQTQNITNRYLSWRSSLSFSHNKNKVLSLGVDALGNKLTYKEIGAGGNWFPMIVGQGMSELLGYNVTGIYQTDQEAIDNGEPQKHAGDYKFQNMQGKGHIIDGTDRITLSHLQPKFTYGFSNDLEYKNFMLSVLIVGSYGNDIVNEFRKYNITMNGKWTPTEASYTKRWQGEGTGNQIDKPSGNSGSAIRDYANSLWVENGSYLRVRDITLGYHLPKSCLRAFKISEARVYVSAQNFITLTRYSGYDPEAAWSANSLINGWDRGVYPASKSLTIGLKVNF